MRCCRSRRCRRACPWPAWASTTRATRPSWPLASSPPDVAQVARRGADPAPMPARSLGALVALLLALVLPTAALAGPPGQWTRISPTNQANIDEAGLARTADGVLHVFFGRHLGGLDNAVEQVAVSPAGHPGTATTVSGGWATLDGPGPVVGADGKTIDLFWGGQISGDPIHQELNYASSPNGGQSWTLSPFNLLVGEQVGMDDLSAARLGSTEYQAWSSYVHVGTVPGPGWHLSASPSASACCGYWASVAADAASGKVVAAWSSNQDGYPGAWAQYLDPVTGAPQGKPMRMPGSAVKYQGVLSSAQLLARTPLVAQTGGSKILMAYPHGYPGNHDAIVWVVGSPA